jgi:hypothetical protein
MGGGGDFLNMCCDELESKADEEDEEVDARLCEELLAVVIATAALGAATAPC